jgi:hypothetical protein
MDLKLADNGDLDVTDNSMSFVSGREAIAQHIRIRLHFVLGEWFLDRKLGIPYFEQILVKSPNLVRVSNIFKEAIMETAGVSAITQFELRLDNPTNSMYVTFKAALDDGEILDFSNAISIEA